MKIFNSFRFHIIRLLSLRKLKDSKLFDKNAIYLTFDDGPEPDITEFVLDELKKYNAKATFFCCGENCAKHPQLLSRIKEEGHTVANHTYSHINGWQTPFNDYIEDVERCETSTKSHIFRPPWGKLTFKQYCKLSKLYRIALWDIVSKDTEMDKLNLDRAITSLENNTKPGQIILFHFCKKHENETKKILPRYLKFLSEAKYNISKL